MPERSLAVIPVRATHLTSSPTVAGRPILGETLWALRRIPEIAHLALALEGVEARACLTLVHRLDELGLKVTRTFDDRWQAILAAIDLYADADLVLLHEPNRPLVSGSRVRDLLRVAAEHDAAAAALPVRSCVKRVAAGRVVETVPREALHIVQGPWAFRAERLYGALQDAIQSGAPPRDELDLVARTGMDLHLVEGHRFDIRIASRADARFFELALERQGSLPNGALLQPT